LQQLLDSTAGWPAGEAAQLAALAVSCLCSYSRRPKLDEVLEPALAALAQKGAAAAAKAAASAATAAAMAVAPTVAAGSNSTTHLAGLSEALTCTICADQLCDPVSTPGGITYCKACILGWLNSGHATCPHTWQPLNANQLVPNYVVRQVLEQLQQPSAGSYQQTTPTASKAMVAGAVGQPVSITAGTDPAPARVMRPELQQQPAPQVRQQQPVAISTESRGIPELVKLLGSASVGVQEAAAGALRNLAAGNAANRLLSQLIQIASLHL
jgi:hypothetical protein